MSCLVHPLGWRLYFSKYWKSNFFIPKKGYLLGFFKARVLFEFVLSVLNSYFVRFWKRNLFRFSRFKIFLSLDTVYVLVHYKFYWRNVFLSMRFYNLEKLALKGGTQIKSYSETSKYFFNSLNKRNFLSVRRKYNYDVLPALFNTNPMPEIISFQLQKLVRFFYLIPYFISIKNILNLIITKSVPSKPYSKIFFIGLSRRNFNVEDILDLIEFFLRGKSKPTFVFYRLIRIFKFLKRKQKLKGFKILLSGRFSRRDRATFLWKTIERVSLGARLSDVSFFSRHIVLPYSKCAVKIWICQS